MASDSRRLAKNCARGRAAGDIAIHQFALCARGRALRVAAMMQSRSLGELFELTLDRRSCRRRRTWQKTPTTYAALPVRVGSICGLHDDERPAAVRPCQVMLAALIRPGPAHAPCRLAQAAARRVRAAPNHFEDAHAVAKGLRRWRYPAGSRGPAMPRTRGVTSHTRREAGTDRVTSRARPPPLAAKRSQV